MASKISSKSSLKRKKKSVDSHGIPPGHHTLQKSNSQESVFHSFPKLQPEGVAQLPESVYDSIVFYIYCSKHDKLALSKSDRNDGCTWLPFVVMNERVPWKKTSHDGVMLLIGRQDSEMDLKEAEKYTPKFEMSCLHLLRIQTSSRKIITRLTQFIHLVNNQQFHCCTDNNFVEWHSSSDLLRNKVDNIWGGELKIFSSMLLSKKHNINCEFTLHDASLFLRGKHPVEQALLKHMGITDIKIYDLFNDYLHHCYPSFYMCFDSFMVYLRRYGHHGSGKYFQKLFRGTALFHKWYVDFHELLIGLLVMEPGHINNDNELRQKFLFAAYDNGEKGHLDKNDLEEMLHDACEGQSQKKDSEKMSSISSTKVVLKEFASSLKKMEKTEHLCRSPKSILSQILELHSKVVEHHHHDGEPLRTECGKDKGVCRACLPKQYEYGAHSIKIDTMGRCVEPIIVSDLWKKIETTSGRETGDSKRKDHKMDPERYSLETVFAISSVPNVFLDLVASYLTSETPSKTIFNPQHEWKTFKSYMSILCADLKSILEAEQKLIRINAPCLVISDIQGNIGDLGYLKKTLFPTFPIQPENLIFLGNYSGYWNNAVEVIIYLFSLKVLAANKVILLRGNFELNAQNAKVLLNECLDKYGQKYGKELFNMILNVFHSMPIAVVVDDNVFCTNTGIPKKDKIDILSKMPKKIENVEQEQPIAFEVLTRFPLGSQKNQMQKSAWFQSSRRSKTSLSRSSSSSTKSTDSSGSHRSSKSHSSVDSATSGLSNSKISSSSSNTSGIKSSAFNSSKHSSPSKKLFSKSGSKVTTKTHESTPKSGSGSRISLSRRSRDPRKPLFLKHNKRKSMHLLLTNSDKLYKKRIISFDKREFHEFLCENNLTFMIRGSSPADKGFKLQFDNRCVSIFSVCNYKSRNNQGSVVLIDGSAQQLRILRYDSYNGVHVKAKDDSADEPNKGHSSTSTLNTHKTSKS